MTARAIPLDVAEPMRSLLAAIEPTEAELAARASQPRVAARTAGLRGITAAEWARRRGVAGSTVSATLTAGDGVAVATLRAAAREAGGVLVIAYRPSE